MNAIVSFLCNKHLYNLGDAITQNDNTERWLYGNILPYYDVFPVQVSV